MKKVFEEIIALLLLLVVVVFHSSVLSAHPTVLQFMNPLLLMSTFFVLAEHNFRGILFALMGAFFLELQSALPFGVLIVAYSASITLLVFTKRYIFKNVALHAFVLNIGISHVVFHLLFFVSLYMFSDSLTLVLEGGSWQHYLQFAFLQTMSHITLISVFFLLERMLVPKFVDHREYEF